MKPDSVRHNNYHISRDKDTTMEPTTKAINKGGRPKVKIKKREHLAVMCNLLERKIIEGNAKKVNLTISEFLRELGLHSRIKHKIKSLPKEVLELKGMLNHVAANLNQIARKRNRNEELNAMERALLNQQGRELKGLTDKIDHYLS